MSKQTKLCGSSDLTMKALIIYDDFAAAAKANATLQGIGRRGDVKVRWIIKPWQVNVLKEEVPAERALAEAVDAHLVLFACHQTQSVPRWIREWLQRWSALRGIEDAALAVVGERIGLADEGHSELSFLARQFGLNFITGDGSAIREAAKVHVRFSREPELALPVERPIFAEAVTSQSYRFAGIND